MPALCKVTYEGQCLNPPTSCCMWIGVNEMDNSGLVLYCEEHVKDFKQLHSIKVLEARGSYGLTKEQALSTLS